MGNRSNRGSSFTNNGGGNEACKGKTGLGLRSRCTSMSAWCRCFLRLDAMHPARTQVAPQPSAQTWSRGAAARGASQTQPPCTHENEYNIKRSTGSSQVGHIRAAVHDKHTIAVNDGVQAMRHGQHLYSKRDRLETNTTTLAVSYRALDEACTNSLLDQQVRVTIHTRRSLVKHKNTVLSAQSTQCISQQKKKKKHSFT
jgi:hypothetical protein